ncbi:type IV toxin-antitoxin system AbiEi family antitoxin domain-containing protein [Conexibacter sp. JD483]|uniref:type IV toxin-antitoxin system AbiEi family antitoxin domain-containing protein n=1 Tax=unclassified Conexibacter TaxID=2627773 RepID=UPI00271CC15C|nr:MULTISPECIES: type IV toxin-antitoxin system AbiEi family antitoxin domain-containing protein [unclassified Conexibacter]MDO8188193.1 type IV toxin-antitoxin system AbiEi family antitoxin domain-containing protein [Conexibacter sp. CPCC 205706]MDO8201600.1 type IV toxin-antitoxin system AbiEi family antitoxin domain-containing protein [Conexibacter sp. CPCC 205762]MDR9372750.1 type IV toxin-antitoxin system AbiEi family antitoxin domain-containing protein [Conexibacter sp. JD483]
MTGPSSEPREVTVDKRQQLHAAPDAVLAELAERQCGVVSRRQLEAAGLTPSMLRVRLERGTLVKLNRGVYAVGHRRLNPRGVRIAALFAAGPGAVLSHRDAAGVHGIRPGNDRATDVTIEGKRVAPNGIRLHRAALPPDEVTRVDGLPLTTVERTLVDLAAMLPRDHLGKALHEADRQRLLDVPSIEAVMERTRGRTKTGHAAMRAALDDLRAGELQLTRSDMEIVFARLIRDHALPRARLNVWIDEREVDAWWPEAGVAVELDSWRDHGTRRAFQRDREKGNLLTLRGVRLLRFTHRDVVERAALVAAQVRAALAAQP